MLVVFLHYDTDPFHPRRDAWGASTPRCRGTESWKHAPGILPVNSSSNLFTLFIAPKMASSHHYCKTGCLNTTTNVNNAFPAPWLRISPSGSSTFGLDCRECISATVWGLIGAHSAAHGSHAEDAWTGDVALDTEWKIITLHITCRQWQRKVQNQYV